MPLYNSKILQLNYDPDIDAVIMKWSGFASSDEFREANEAVLRLLKENNCNKILADARDMKIISVQDQQWLYQDWLSRTIRAGLEYAAIVESDDFFNRLSIDNVAQKINDRLSIKFFNTLLGARNWLKGL